MTTEPQQRSLEVPYLWRIPTIYRMPQFQQATVWRTFVYNQPIAMLCRARLINYILGLPWEIAPRDPNDKDKVKDDVKYYTDWVLAHFDAVIDPLWQDSLDLPVGGSIEITRWPIGFKPMIEVNGEEYKVTRDHPKGHPFSLINIDGATLFPTYNDDLPLAQRIPDTEAIVYFTPDQLGRIGIQPRTEMRLKGYFKPPPEQIFLAMQMVGDTDHYYHDLLKETPPVGILDLMDMQQKQAQDWVGSVRSLFEGNDPFKIPILYDHEHAANFIPFGKSPQELLMDTAGLRYSRIVAASYGLTLGNIGLEPKGETLAGSIRDDQQAATGYNFVVEKTKGMIDADILPPYLEWSPKIQDNEKLTGKGRAFLVNAQAVKVAIDAKMLKPSEGQAQLVRDGFITVDVEPPNDEEIAKQAEMQKPAFGQSPNGQAKQLTDKVPAAEGGMGDVKKEKADYKYASTQFDMPDSVIRQLHQLHSQIDPSDLAEDGLEANPHITIKYGLTNDSPDAIKQIAQAYQPFYIQTGKTSLFLTNEDFDVVKIEIESDTLRQLNSHIAMTGAVDTHPGYNPHLTIAYVKPGAGQRYLGLSLPRQSVLVATISHSTSDGYISKIPLGDFRQMKAATTSAKQRLTAALKPALTNIADEATDGRLKKLVKETAEILEPVL